MERKILPIIVIYRCRLTDATAYQSLIAGQGVDEFVVYDNSPEDDLQQEGNMPAGAHYYHDRNNGGLSRAYNYGAQVAQQLGYDFLLLLDQDTQFAPDAFQTYLAATQHHMMLVPNVVLGTSIPFSPVRPTWTTVVPENLEPGEYPLSKFRAINSGCCVPVDLFVAAGGYNEKVRLDFSDYEFQRRLSKVSDRIYVLPTTCKQDFSNEEQDAQKLLRRFLFFLEGARAFGVESLRDRVHRSVVVLKHTMALFCRTKDFKFITYYFKHYLFKR